MAMRAAGLLAGMCLVALLALQTWRVPASPRAAGVEADLRAVPSGEVGVSPAGAVLGRGAVMTPGGPPVRGRVRLSNRTAGALAARPLVAGGDRALDRVVEIELTVAGRVVFRGPLGGLRDGVSTTSVPLPRAGSATVVVSARVPAAAADEAVGRAGRWTLTFSSSSETR
jgi:hypothetical protein